MSILKPTDIKKLLVARSERVKTVDLHPKEPIVLASLYSGQVTMWNYETQTMIKSFDIVDQPVRCCKFMVRLQSFACGADDLNIRIYNYNTMEKVKTFEAHQDYIRSIAVHDQLPYLLTASDDMTVKLWDWSKGWINTLTFEGHAHYVMQVVFNPKDPSTFATASLDETIKVWSVTSAVCNFTLEGHEKGVNCVEYYNAGDKPYLVSGSDDHTVRVWDYQTKACIQVLSHHSHNVPCVYFHPELPLLITGSEDETVGIFNTQTWRQEQTLNYGLQRVWTVTCRNGKVALGFDKGLIVVRIGRDDLCVSMDNTGKILCTNNQEILRMDIKGVLKDVADGEPILLATKEIGTSEATAQKILHGPSGQYIAVLTEGEYTINSSLAWRPKCFGPAVAFVWGGGDSGSYAILENSTTLKVHRTFKLRDTIKLPFAADALYGGPLLGIRVEGSIVFYDWDKFRVVRKVDVVPKDVQWSDSGELLAIITETGTFLLKYNAAQVNEHLEANKPIGPDGLESCFDVVEEMEERVKQAQWVGDCLVYVNQGERLNYYIGGEVTTIAVLPRQMHLLGFLAKESRVFLIDKERNVVSYQLFVSVIDYKTAIVREDFEAAAAALPKIPDNMRHKVAQFLQARGLLALALDVTTEEDHKFELAVTLGNLPVAVQLTRATPSSSRWKQVGDLALERAYFDLAEEALGEAGDDNGLLLLFTCTNNLPKLAALGRSAATKGKTNVAFSCFHLTGNHDGCIDLLVQTQKIAEAAFYARTYKHDRVDELVAKWRLALAGVARVRDAIADPATFPNLFPNMERPTKPSSQPGSAQQSPERCRVEDATPARTAAPTAAVASPSPAAAVASPPPAQHQSTPPPSAHRGPEPAKPTPPPSMPKYSPSTGRVNDDEFDDERGNEADVASASKPHRHVDPTPPAAPEGDEFDDEFAVPASSLGEGGAAAPPAAHDDLDDIWGKDE